jgi:hypothetical protein
MTDTITTRCKVLNSNVLLSSHVCLPNLPQLFQKHPNLKRPMTIVATCTASSRYRMASEMAYASCSNVDKNRHVDHLLSILVLRARISHRIGGYSSSPGRCRVTSPPLRKLLKATLDAAPRITILSNPLDHQGCELWSNHGESFATAAVELARK